MEQKNFLLAVVLSIGFLFVWSVFVVPRFTPPPQPAPPEHVSPKAELADKPTEITGDSAHPVFPATPSMVLRDERNEVVLASAGGAVQAWRLKLKGQEIDLATGLELETFPEAAFKISQKDNRVIMESPIGKGIRLTKILSLNPNGYLHDLSFRFENSGPQAVEVPDFNLGWGPGLGTTQAEHKENARQIRALQMGKLKAHALKPGEYGEPSTWAGIDNRYFLVALLPPSGEQPKFVVEGVKDQTSVSLNQTVTVPAHGVKELHYQLYVGPKGYTQLKKYGKNLEEGVDFGTFSPLGKLILSALYRLKKLTGNYGWSIVLLTIGLQILLLPLSIKSFRATLAMKQLQPQIALLQKQYKSDPKRLNVEMMNIYKKSGTNPLGGCLPMVLQLPIFWALFTTLRNAYELRGEPWLGWIHDLSAADPYHIMPVVMALGMFAQQRLSGAVTDPTQKQMMFMMPAMFLVMFWNFPAGLVLYWLTNSLLTMLFQFLFLRAHDQNSPQIVETTLVK